MSTENKETKVDSNQQATTTPTAPKQETKPTSDSKDPFSILDFVKDQLKAKEATPTTTETKPTKKATSKKAEAKVTTEAKTTEAKTTEATTESTTEEADVEISALSKSLLGDTDEVKTDETKDEAKTEETKEEDTDVKLPETASVAAKDAFKKVNADRTKLKKELAELKTQKEELEKKIAEATNDDAAKTIADLQIQLEQYRKDNEAAETKLFALDVQQTKRYNELITTPLQLIANEVEDIAKKASIDPSALRKAMVASDTKVLADLISESDINDFDKVQLAKLRGDVKDVLKTREALESDSKAAAEAFRRAEEEQFKLADSQKRKEYSTSLQHHKAVINNVMPALFKPIEGDDNWNTLLEQYNQFLEVADPTTFTAEKTAQTISMAGATPILFAALDKVIADNKVLTDRIKKLTKANPSAGPSATTSTAATAAPKQEGSIGDFVKEQMARRFSGR